MVHVAAAPAVDMLDTGDLHEFAGDVLQAIGMIDASGGQAPPPPDKKRKKSLRERLQEAATDPAAEAPVAAEGPEDPEGDDSPSVPTCVRRLVALGALQEHSLGNVLRDVERGRAGFVVISSDIAQLKPSRQERLYYGLQDGDVPHAVVAASSAALGLAAGCKTAVAITFRLDDATRPLVTRLQSLGTPMALPDPTAVV
eukprot:TRINITY_DN5990_c0_g1_i1.p2 TRINITY_DN5990_c0_g1~~TRINITY_DN5990_c0_g1_i1.p2  ORF type:complete len:199 (+),score=75.75 TRINITY_DN5990_c0_g1_i1:211-807(+)